MKNRVQNHISDETLRTERSRYHVLVQNQMLKQNFHENRYKKIASFVYVTLILGGFFTWSSSGPGSNIYSLVNGIVDYIRTYIPTFNSTIFVSLIVISLLTIVPIALVNDTKKIKVKINFQSLLRYQTQKRLFNQFIKQKIQEKENVAVKTNNDLLEIIDKKSDYNITFTSNDFENFLEEAYENYEINIGIDFFSNLADLILLNQCIENTLILKDLGTDSTYSLKIDGNISLF